MIVVDASVAVQWIAAEADSEHSEALLGRGDLIAPELLQVEVANVICRKVGAGDMTLEQGREGLELIAAEVEIEPLDRAWLDRALDIAIQMAHPIYDCIYLAMAQQFEARLLTRDRRLVSRASRLGLGHLVGTLPLSP